MLLSILSFLDSPPCDNVVCANNGTCVDTGIEVDDYRCECTAEWFGQRCEGICNLMTTFKAARKTSLGKE